MTKPLLLALGLAAGTLRAQAQQPLPVVAPAVRYQFCELKDPTAGRLRLYYGWEEYSKEFKVEDADLAKQAALIEKLSSISVALNYLSAQGWEVVGVTAAPARTSGSDIYSEPTYLLRRRLPVER